MTSRAKPRPPSKRDEGFNVVSAAIRVRSLQPSLRAKSLWVGEVALHRSDMAGQQVNTSALRHADIADHGVRIDFQPYDRYNWFEPHRLVRGGLDVMQCLGAR